MSIGTDGSIDGEVDRSPVSTDQREARTSNQNLLDGVRALIQGAKSCLESGQMSQIGHARYKVIEGLALLEMYIARTPVVEMTPRLSKSHAKRIIQDWIEDNEHVALVKASWPDLHEAYVALKAIADSPVETSPPLNPISPLELATLFHDRYEELAPHFGYETRKDTRQFSSETPNGRLMIAVCARILDRFRPAVEPT